MHHRYSNTEGIGNTRKPDGQMRVVTDVTYYYESKSIIHSKQGSQLGSAIDNILPVLVVVLQSGQSKCY